MRISATGRYIPPYTYGFSGPLTGGTQQADVSWSTPTGLVTPQMGSGTATVVYTSDTLPASNGYPVIIPSQQIPLGTLTSVNGATTTTMPLPLGANSLLVMFTEAQVTHVLNITVTGTQSGTQFVASSNPRIANPAVGLISTVADTSVTFGVTCNLAGIVFTLAASYASQAVGIQPSGEGINVIGSGALGEVLVQPAGFGTWNVTTDQAVTNTAGQILAANAARKGFVIQNVGGVSMRIDFNATPSANKGLRIQPGVSFSSELPFCPNIAINAISETATSTNAMVVEYT
jgi:hypothetical protein